MINEVESIKKEPIFLSPKDFAESFKNVPRLAVNLIITSDKDGVLLVRRSIPPQEGFWHIPGGFLLKNETIETCRVRIARKELGLELTGEEKIELLGAFEDLAGDPRGHVVDLVFGIKLDKGIEGSQTNENAQVKFFNVLPENIGFNHRDTLRRLGF